MGLGRALMFARNDRHRSRWEISEHRGVRFGFVQLFAQCCDLFLDHLFERRLLVAVINSKEDQGRNATKG